MKTNLQLTLHHMPNNEGMLSFSNPKERVRISGLCNSLQFMGNMKQLSQAIDSEGKQDCYYELKNRRGLEWVLNCRLVKSIVAVELWFQQFGSQDHLEILFNWEGKVSEFRDSVNFMIDKAGRYKYFARG